MEKSTEGIAVFLVGIVIFLQSLAQQQEYIRFTYVVVGVILISGGLWYASKKERLITERGKL